MLQKIESYIREYHMIEAGSHVVAGVSGGADSVCLLLVLLRLKERLGYTLSAVHVEHGIRGEDALRDAAFVRRLCREKGVDCRVCRCSVPDYAKRHGMGEEEAGRHLRYAFFEEEKKTYEQKITCGAVRIAVAHHIEDNAETMLFHLARGTGIRGLAGIAPVRGDIIRPLLTVSREEIMAYLSRQGQEYCSDVTNESDCYSRNKVRRAILPVMAQINSRAAVHMYEAAVRLREIDGYLQKQARQALQACCTKQGQGMKINRELLEREEPVLRAQMMYQLLADMAGSARDLTNVQIRQLLELFDRQNGKRLQLPYGLAAVRVYDGVEIFFVQNAEKTGKKPLEYEKSQFSFRILEEFSYNIVQISKKKYTKCFDYDKIKIGFCVRNRMPGDYLVINDEGSRQKLKKYMVNEKIPAKEREQLLLLADGAHIMWVVGYRISSYYKVDEHTRRILEVTFYGGKEDE